MNTYEAKKNLKLTILDRVKKIEAGEIVEESIYTELYPHFFKKISTISGYDKNLAEPKEVFVETETKEEKTTNTKNTTKLKEVKDTKKPKEIKSKLVSS